MVTSRDRFPTPQQETQSTVMDPSMFRAETPEGWVAAEPSQYRLINFRLPGDPPGEAYFSVLSGGGTLKDNVDRWRGQMGLAPLSNEEFDALPTRPLFGFPGPYVELTGKFSGGMGSKPIDEAMLLGVLVAAPGTVLTVKLVATTEVALAERESFFQFCESIALADAPDTPEPLAWEVPDGWTTGPAREMRTVTLYPLGEPGAECWVTVLPGETGGLEDNVNRWRSEMGEQPLPHDSIASLPRIPMLEGEAVVVEARGDYEAALSALGRVENALLLGAIGSYGTSTVFVKMVGPATEMEAHREAFAQFCASLRPRGEP